MEKIGILEDLMTRTKAQYISDLRGSMTRKEIRENLKKIMHEGYSVKEWIDAIFYMTDEHIEFQTIEEIKKYIDTP